MMIVLHELGKKKTLAETKWKTFGNKKKQGGLFISNKPKVLQKDQIIVTSIQLHHLLF